MNSTFVIKLNILANNIIWELILFDSQYRWRNFIVQFSGKVSFNIKNAPGDINQFSDLPRHIYILYNLVNTNTWGPSKLVRIIRNLY